jgi:DNA polymerase V
MLGHLRRCEFWHVRLAKAAIHGLELIYQPGFAFSKAEILLVEICQPVEYTPDLFAKTQPAASQKVMQVMDQINAKWGRGTMRPGRVPVTPDWGMKREMLSPSYTTRIDQLWRIKR